LLLIVVATSVGTACSAGSELGVRADDPRTDAARAAASVSHDGAPLSEVIVTTDEVGATLSPPSDLRPPGDVERARANVEALFGSEAAKSMTAFLALLTSPSRGYEGLPVWAFIDELPCSELPGPKRLPGGPSRQPHPDLTCAFVVLTDASTAEYLFAYQEPIDARSMVPPGFTPQLKPPAELVPDDVG
jgi:hypothetical protein